ncbi:MAG: transcriptional regulator [Bacteroidota bacterium]|nr:transcriptional regulator [Bacteroidota bacterium]
MVAVITGDVINSKKNAPRVWLTPLKKELNRIGKTPKTWEIYRGDSFQIVMNNPEDALLIAMKLKASLKSVKGINVRMAIGLGSRTYNAAKVTESNGSAFVNSGEKFEMLKQEKQNLAIKSDSYQFDNEMNLYLKLALIAMNNWTVNAAEIVRVAMENPEKSQQQLGKMIGIKQSAISTRLRRAYFEEIMEVNEMYKAKLKLLK